MKPNVRLEIFRTVAFVVSSSVIAIFLSTYKWLSASFNIRDFGFIAAMFAVLLFMAFMIWNLKSVKRPDHYILEVYNVLGEVDDASFRKEFKNYDVAVSYMEMYRGMYPYYRFILVSNGENSKKTVHKWIE